MRTIAGGLMVAGIATGLLGAVAAANASSFDVSLAGFICAMSNIGAMAFLAASNIVSSEADEAEGL